MNYFIAFDVETGGIGDDKSLLTAYFAFLKYDNLTFTKLDELDLVIKPDNDVYCVTAESLEITQIDLKQHNRNAVYQRKAGTMLYDKLSNWYKAANSNKLVPVGHNVAFDIRKICTTLVNRGSWEQFVSYRVMDTSTIAQFYRLTGKLPENVSGSLVGLTDYFQITDVDGVPHQAKYDTLNTVKVLENLMRI